MAGSIGTRLRPARGPECVAKDCARQEASACDDDTGTVEAARVNRRTDKTLHIGAGDSGCGSLRAALRDAGRTDDVLPFLDDLSCGPIDADDPAARARFWAPCYDAREVEETVAAFWDRIATSDERLVVWFGRHCARELAFFLCWVDRLGERPYDIVDVAGRTQPTRVFSIVPPKGLQELLGEARALTVNEHEEASRRWRRLRQENAPFRVVTPAGLESAPADCFDASILKHAGPNWRTIGRVIRPAEER